MEIPINENSNHRLRLRSVNISAASNRAESTSCENKSEIDGNGSNRSAKKGIKKEKISPSSSQQISNINSSKPKSANQSLTKRSSSLKTEKKSLKFSNKAAIQIKLSSEEVRMNGAPQGPVYKVETLETEQIKPCVDALHAEDELKSTFLYANMLSNNSKFEDWAELYSAIDSTRRLAIHHSDILTEKVETFSALMGLLKQGIESGRSSVCRNSLIGLGEILTHLCPDSLTKHFSAVLGLVEAALLRSCSKDKKFIAKAAFEALLSGTKGKCSHVLLKALILCSSTKNADINGRSIFFIESCLEKLLEFDLKEWPESVEIGPLIACLRKGIKEKSVEGKLASKRALNLCKRCLGEDIFEAEIKRGADGAEILSVLAAKQTVKKSQSIKETKSKLNGFAFSWNESDQLNFENVGILAPSEVSVDATVSPSVATSMNENLA